MSESSRPDRLILAAFLLVVLLGGSNSVAIRYSNQELAPFWGAALRFVFAAAAFWIILWWRKLPLPNLKDSSIIALNGFLTIGISFALLYWGLLKVPVSLATIVIATSPLFTFLLAVLHRIESFRIQALVGGGVALIGMAIAVNAQPGGVELLPSLLALAAGALVAAEGNVIFKIYSLKADSVVINALSISSGALFLLGTSLIAGNAWVLPSTPQVWAALTYLILGGSVVMFYLFVYVLSRWTASATSYAVLFFPLVATLLASWLVKETVTPLFLAGATIVIAGVWIGAFFGTSGA
ncbi:MAG: EamA family transporter [Anaerolineales bacterium]|nr:EamA family transporter [Anaerolineales bacterium]